MKKRRVEVMRAVDTRRIEDCLARDVNRWDRDMLYELLRRLNDGGSLSPKQRGAISRILETAPERDDAPNAVEELERIQASRPLRPPGLT